MATTTEFLGNGWSFPFRFTRRSGGVFKGLTVAETEGENHIRESIMQIVGIRMGTRVIRRDFGSSARGLIFEPNDPQLDIQIDYLVRTAIERWEPRVAVGPIRISRSEKDLGRLEISLEFYIIKTNSIQNLVFPFFLSETDRKTFVTPSAG